MYLIFLNRFRNLSGYGLLLILPGCILGSYNKAGKSSYEFYSREVPESRIFYKIRFDGIYYYKYTEQDIYNSYYGPGQDSINAQRSWKSDSANNRIPRYKYLKFMANGQVKSVSHVSEGPDESWVGGGGYSNGYFTIIKDTIFFSTKQAASDPELLKKAYFIKDTLVVHHYMTKDIWKRTPYNGITQYLFFKNTVNNFY